MHGRDGLHKRAHGLVEFGVVRAPHEVAFAYAAKVDRPFAELQLQLAAARFGQTIDPPAFFLFLRAAPARRVKDQPVAGLERRGFARRFFGDDDAITQDLGDAAHQYAAVARRAPIDYGLMIRAADEIRPEAARIDLFEPQLFLPRDAQRQLGPRFVYGLAVRLRGQRDVVRVFVAAFDL